MKIVHLIWGLNVGGAETMLVDIANMQAEDHDVWLIIGNDDVDVAIVSALDSRAHGVFLARPPGSRNPWYALKLLSSLWRIRPDVIHVHQESFIRLKRLMPAPLLLTIHDTRSRLSPALAGYDSICCISEAVKNDVMARFPFSDPRVVHNGVKFSSIAVKQRYGETPFRIVQVSRLEHEKKGQDLLIRALRIVHGILGEDRVTVDFIGEGSSQEFLLNLAIECNVANHCSFLGVKSRQYIYANLHTYDLLVQPSRYEGFGLTIVEGIAAGLPVLVSDIEGPMEIIDGGNLGSCFRSDDVADCAAKIIELISESQQSDFSKRMKKRNDYAASRFDVGITAHNYVDEYRKLPSIQRVL
jgi:glycosyltransferase involved in cell wall biosynthesis